jgi:xanthine/CO dehydrogenase XdhC/CoxF family maturation factor
MKELQDIVTAFEKVEHCGQTAALATLVKAQGSTYRRPGARMLMTLEGQMIGSLSGGCLESDVFEQAQEVMVSGEPIVVKYDTMSDEDIVWGLGLGCNGIVEILIERLPQESELNPVAFVAQCLCDRQKGVLARVFRTEGQVGANVGACWMLYPDGTVTSNITDAELATGILHDAREVLGNNQSTGKTYHLSAGSAEVFIEVIQPSLPLVIFGAGHDAVPLVRFAKELGWHVTVVDSREAYATESRFPLADAIVVSRPESIGVRVPLHPDTVAVVMTHNYLHDKELLQTLLLSPLRYIGLLGPKRRTDRILQELREEGLRLTNAQLGRLYGPVGLDIGADAPEEIALSIVAEIRAVLANRSGGLLRDRAQPIHNRSAG